MSAAGYVLAAYGGFMGLLGLYVGILVPRTRARQAELAVLEASDTEEHA
jgi:hypothetical protein